MFLSCPCVRPIARKPDPTINACRETHYASRHQQRGAHDGDSSCGDSTIQECAYTANRCASTHFGRVSIYGLDAGVTPLYLSLLRCCEFAKYLNNQQFGFRVLREAPKFITKFC